MEFPGFKSVLFKLLNGSISTLPESLVIVSVAWKRGAMELKALFFSLVFQILYLLKRSVCVWVSIVIFHFCLTE